MKFLICIFALTSVGCSTLDVQVDIFNRSYMSDPKFVAESVREQAASVRASRDQGELERAVQRALNRVRMHVARLQEQNVAPLGEAGDQLIRDLSAVVDEQANL